MKKKPPEIQIFTIMRLICFCLVSLCLSATNATNSLEGPPMDSVVTASHLKPDSQDLKLDDLPTEMLDEILSRLPKKDQHSYKLINRRFWSSFNEHRDVLNQFLISNSHGAMSMEKVELAIQKLIQQNPESRPTSLNISNIRTCLSEKYLYPASISFDEDELLPFFTESPHQEIKNSSNSSEIHSSGMFIYMEVRRKKLPFLLQLIARRSRQSFLALNLKNLHPSLESSKPLNLFSNSQNRLLLGAKGEFSDEALSTTKWYEERPLIFSVSVQAHRHHRYHHSPILHGLSLAPLIFHFLL